MTLTAATAPFLVSISIIFAIAMAWSELGPKLVAVMP